MSDEYSIEDIHEMLDELDEAIEWLNSLEVSKIEVSEIPHLYFIIGQLSGWYSIYSSDLPTEINVPPSQLNKLKKIRGIIDTYSALNVANRIKSFLRTVESNHSISPTEEIIPKEQHENKTTIPVQKPLSVSSSEWILVKKSDSVQNHINALINIFDNTITRINNSNLPPEEYFLNELERAQLIALLETTLNMLKSPMVETGMLKKVSASLKDAAKKASNKKLQEGFGNILSETSDLIANLLKDLF